MALPKVASVKFDLTVPSTKKVIRFRPFVVSEEKALLIAMESKDPSQMAKTMNEVVSACIEDQETPISELPFFDAEFIFLNLRAKSVGEKVNLQYRHVDSVNLKGEKCDAITKIEIDLEHIKVNFPENHKSTIALTDKMGIKMKYPTLNDIISMKETSTSIEIDLIAKCIDCVYVGDEVHSPDDLADSKKFLESLTTLQFGKISVFFETMPKVKHVLEYDCSGCGQHDTVTLEGTADFF